MARGAAATETNGWNVTALTNHGFDMLYFCLLWVSLVLGEVAGCLWDTEVLRGKWLQMARAVARMRRPVWQCDWRIPRSFMVENIFLPSFRGVVTRAGPPLGLPAL